MTAVNRPALSDRIGALDTEMTDLYSQIADLKVRRAGLRAMQDSATGTQPDQPDPDPRITVVRINAQTYLVNNKWYVLGHDGIGTPAAGWDIREAAGRLIAGDFADFKTAIDFVIDSTPGDPMGPHNPDHTKCWQCRTPTA